MRGWWQDLTDLVLPAECGGCGRPRTALCPECCAALDGAAPRRVRPVPEPPGLPAVHAAARYADAVRAVLLAHKERGALGLAGPLGSALAGAVWAGVREVRETGDEGAAWGRVLLVPVPSARRAVRARGHDPARRIALAAAGELRRTGMPARVVAVLRQRRGVADQSGLNSRQRMDNLAGALTVVPGGGRLLSEGLVVLVDDLMTTGATLAEAARAVREAREGEQRGHLGAGAGVRGEHRGLRACEGWAGPRGQQAWSRDEQMAAGRRDQRQQGVGGGPAQRGGLGGLRQPESGAEAGRRQSESERWSADAQAAIDGWRERARAVRDARDGHGQGVTDERADQGPTESRRSETSAWLAPGQPGAAGSHRGRSQGPGGARKVRGVGGCGSDGESVVYTAATREGMRDRMIAGTEEDTARERCQGAAGAGGVRDLICAAVVAASPDSSEINRN